MDYSPVNLESPPKAFVILQLASSLSEKAGGVQQTLMGLSNHLAFNRFQFEFLSFKEERQSFDSKSLRGNIHLFKAFSFPFFPISFSLLRALWYSNASLLHVHGLWEFPSFATRYWPDLKPLVISPHGMLDPWALQNSAWKKGIALCIYERKNLNRCNCFHALNLSEYQSIRSLGFRQPIAVIPNGVELPDQVQNLRVTAGEKRTLFYLGRFHKKKNLKALISAWRNIPGDLKKGWHLRLAGWGDHDYTRELSAMLGSDVSLEGPLYGKAKDKAFQEASAFILPSLSEGLPVAVLEAWSYGLPVLISKECHLPEGFEAGAAFETGTVEISIKESLVRFLRISDEKRKEMGQKGRDLVEERFTWPIAASKMVSVYLWLLGQGPKPDCVVV